MERLEFDLLFRWFVGLGIDDAVWDHSTFSKNRDRLLEGEIAARFLAAVLAQPRVKRLLSSEHFSVDGTLIEAWASMKSFKPKESPDAGGTHAGGRNVPAQNLRGLRSLQGEQGAVIENGQRAIRQLGGNMSEVGSFGSGVDDEKEPLAPGFVIEPRHHQIVENMAMAIEQLRIAHPPWSKGGDIARH